MTPFETRTEILDDGTTVVAVAGEIDMATAAEFEKTMHAALDTQLDRPVLVDLTECGFLDSTALKVLIAARHRYVESEPMLALIADDPSLLRLFEISGLDGCFAIHPSRPAVNLV